MLSPKTFCNIKMNLNLTVEGSFSLLSPSIQSTLYSTKKILRSGDAGAKMLNNFYANLTIAASFSLCIALPCSEIFSISFRITHL